MANLTIRFHYSVCTSNCPCDYALFYIFHAIGGLQGLALLTLSWDKNWDSHSLVNGYPSFYPRIALVAPSPEGSNISQNHTKMGKVNTSSHIDSDFKQLSFTCHRCLLHSCHHLDILVLSRIFLSHPIGKAIFCKFGNDSNHNFIIHVRSQQRFTRVSWYWCEMGK